MVSIHHLYSTGFSGSDSTKESLLADLDFGERVQVSSIVMTDAGRYPKKKGVGGSLYVSKFSSLVLLPSASLEEQFLINT